MYCYYTAGTHITDHFFGYNNRCAAGLGTECTNGYFAAF